MLKIILDTDMGVDCDDAVALGLLLNAERKKRLELIAITASTTREGATGTAKAICDYYGAGEKPMGRLISPVLKCDEMNRYAKKCKDKYGTTDSNECAVKVLRKAIATCDGKVTIVAVGPLTNIAQLLQSSADEYSSLDGKALVKKKVEKVLIMGGSFSFNNDMIGRSASHRMAEWNVLQDIGSAIYVTDNLPVETVWVPWEAGYKVFTNLGVDDNPVWFCMYTFAEALKFSEDNVTENGNIHRYSWDPITAMFSYEDLSEYFDLSPFGTIRVSEKGYTEWREGEGNARFLIVKGGFEKLGKLIDAQMAE